MSFVIREIRLIRNFTFESDKGNKNIKISNLPHFFHCKKIIFQVLGNGENSWLKKNRDLKFETINWK